jgi:hypothetical protein
MDKKTFWKQQIRLVFLLYLTPNSVQIHNIAQSYGILHTVVQCRSQRNLKFRTIAIFEFQKYPLIFSKFIKVGHTDRQTDRVVTS